MDGFDIELKRGIILSYHGKPFYHLADLLEQIRRDATAGRTKDSYSYASGFTVRLGRNPNDLPPTAAEWLEVVNEIMPIVEDIKQKRKGTRALHDAIVSLDRSKSAN
jgi:hypothetical protein